MKAGDVVDVEVVDVRDNGLVLRAEGLEGFMNVTEFDWWQVVKPHDVAQKAGQLRVKVYAVTDRFFASLKQLTERVMPVLGSVHRGHVHSIASFGVFVRLSFGAIGLLRDGQGLAVGDAVEIEVTSLQKLEFRRVACARHQ